MKSLHILGNSLFFNVHYFVGSKGLCDVHGRTSRFEGGIPKLYSKHTPKDSCLWTYIEKKVMMHMEVHEFG